MGSATRNLPYDGYIRQSKTADDARSPSQQREIIERTAETLGASVGAWHTDLGTTGSTMRRDGLDAAVGRIRAGRSAGLIIAFLDRFSRARVSEAMTVMEAVQAHGGRIVFADTAGLNPDDPTGEFTLTSLLAAKRLEWRQTSERWAATRHDAVMAGKAIGGAPFGYRYADATPRERGRKGVVDSRLVVDEFEAGMVRDVFERKAAGATWLELARYLDAVAPKPDGSRWARSTVAAMVCRRTYLGEVRHGDNVNAEAHDAIVGPGVWRRAQNEPGRRTPRGSYLLSGLVRCAGCGRRMRGSTQGARAKPIYTCPGSDCSSRSTVLVGRLDAEVLGQLWEHLDEFHVRAVSDEEMGEATAEVERLTDAVKRLAAVVPSHPAAIEGHQEALDDAERKLAAAEDHLDQLIGQAAASGPDLRRLRDDFDDLPVADRREIVRSGIDVVLVRRASRRTPPHPPLAERVLVLFRGQAPGGLVDGGRAGPVRRWSWDDDPGSLRASS